LRRNIVKRVAIGRLCSFRDQDQDKSKERPLNPKFEPWKFGELVKGIRRSKKMVKRMIYFLSRGQIFGEIFNKKWFFLFEIFSD